MGKLIIKNNTNLNYVIKSDSFANANNAIDIWIKFTKSLNQEEIQFLNEVKSKPIDTLSSDEIDMYNKIKEQLEVSNLLLKYKNKDCTKKEHDLVSKFMDKSLSRYVKSKVSKEEQEEADLFIEELLNEDKIQDYIDIKEEEYDELNVYDAYVLFMAKEKMYEKNSKELNDKILNDQKERAFNLRKSLKRDYGC